MILVNNRNSIEWEEGLTVAALLQKCRFTARQINVFVNDELIPPDAYAMRVLQDDDRVRVVHFIAGG